MKKVIAKTSKGFCTNGVGGSRGKVQLYQKWFLGAVLLKDAVVNVTERAKDQ